MDLAEKEFRVAWRLIVDKGYIPVRRKSERELFIQCENGTMIECRSEEQPDQLIGEGLDLVVLAEAARLKQRTWDQYLRPALADRRGKALFTSTPRGFNYFQKFYNRGQAQDAWEAWESWTVPSRMNPLLDATEIEDARAGSTPEAFAQEWEAKFIAYAGLVFPEFSHEIHVVKSLHYEPHLKTALWIDPGASAPYAVLLVQITPEDEIHVLDEIYMTQKTTPEIIQVAKLKWGEHILTESGYPRQELKVVIDKAAAEAAAIWRINGFDAGGEKPTIKKGIEVHHYFLGKNAEGEEGNLTPHIYFSPRCTNAISEHSAYHYPDAARKRIDTNPSELPVDVDNHTIDALRYGYYNTFPWMFNEEPEEETVYYGTMADIDPDIPEMVSLGDY